MAGSLTYPTKRIGNTLPKTEKEISLKRNETTNAPNNNKALKPEAGQQDKALSLNLKNQAIKMVMYEP